MSENVQVSEISGPSLSQQPPTQNRRKCPKMSENVRVSEISGPSLSQQPPHQRNHKRGETMTLARIRREVNALCRKFAPQLAARRAKLEIESATPITEDFCDDMEAALTADEPGPIMNGAGWSLVPLRRPAPPRHPPHERRRPEPLRGRLRYEPDTAPSQRSPAVPVPQSRKPRPNPRRSIAQPKPERGILNFVIPSFGGRRTRHCPVMLRTPGERGDSRRGR